MKIGIIGAGPRGLSVAERLIMNAEEKLEILLFDPFPAGGTVWRTQQSDVLLMNSVAQQVTLFTDETCEIRGEIQLGPNLYQWSKTEAEAFIDSLMLADRDRFLNEAVNLAPNDYCHRSFYGLYQKWFFQQLQQTGNIVHVEAEVIGLTREPLALQTSKDHYLVDRVVIATGNYPNELTKEEQGFADYAKEHDLLYQPPSNAADSIFTEVSAGETVILRGLGLNFFDYVGLFSEARGGYFEASTTELIYHPSGQEPKIIAGSRSGMPYHARAVNQKHLGEIKEPQFLTDERLQQFKKNDPSNATVFFDLMKKEVELTYYQQLSEELALPVEKATFTAAFIDNSERALKEYQIPKKYWWDWEKAAEPAVDVAAADFEAFLAHYMEKDIREARKGNLTGPFSTGVDTMKDLRDPVRYMLDHELFTATDYIKKMWGDFADLNEFLTIGPPIKRLRQLLALYRAGIVTFLAPDMKVELKNGRFVVFSQQLPERTESASVLIEARVPAPSAAHTKNPLIKSLLEQGLTTPHIVKAGKEVLETGALMIQRGTNRLIAENGDILEDIYCYGIPVEGIDWLTASTNRPYTNERNLRQADHIACLILGK